MNLKEQTVNFEADDLTAQIDETAAHYDGNVVGKSAVKRIEVQQPIRIKNKPVYSFIKRVFDLILSFIASIVLLIPIAVIAIVIICKDPGNPGIRGEKVTPTVAIVDPTYTFKLPLTVTMETGFDVFAHAAESYCAVKADPFSEMLSEKSIKIVGEALPRLAKNLDDIEAREMMSFASHIMGYNLKNIGNCLPHRLQYPIGVITETSHGAGLIALYPSWIKHESTVNPTRISQILDWLGGEGGQPEDRIRKWLDKMNISRNITDLGKVPSAEKLAEMVSGNLKNDKLADEDDIIVTLYKESM